ncbi:hypothetical protein LTS18_010641 [Coniosporium uncinatum]|uniref:Uncharacterized protein n=1 Tax=Coniosporium uncinatum TaxID=93489 RepID=A0ACC3DZD5_9PEZI|nr:hypothetical protein LTS18_010641 [Coniosporium uncinatum]
MQDGKAAIPKFGSFKPKATLSATPKNPSTNPSPPRDDNYVKRVERSSRDTSQDNRHHRYSHKHVGRSPDREHKHHRRYRDESHDHREERCRERREQGGAQVIDSNNLNNIPWNEGPELYTVDRRGDVQNIKYGSLSHYSIPPYRRTGYGNIVGLSKHDKIDRDRSDDRGIVLEERGPARSERASRLSREPVHESRKVRLIAPSASDPGMKHDADFVPIHSNRKRKRGSETPDAEQSGVDYRSIEGKAKADARPTDADPEYISGSSDADIDRDASGFDFAEIQQKNAMLSRRVKENPDNLDSWLDLIKHQEAMMGLGHGRKLTGSEQRSLAEVRISIFEQALSEKLVRGPARVTLLLGMLEQGSKIWESKKQASKWEEVLTKNADIVELWTKYLNFAQTNGTEFKYEACRLVYTKCLDVLDKALKKQTESISAVSKIHRIQIYVLLRLTCMMRDAGYHEHAIAMWQATLEYIILRPKEVDSSAALGAFEEFWESEVPRIGEGGAQGWARFHTHGGEAPKPDAPELSPHIDQEDCFGLFLQTELAFQRQYAMPGRTADEAGQDDPYHVVLFSDIVNYLQVLPVDLPATILLEAFLRFCGLPPLPAHGNERSMQHLWLDPLVDSSAKDGNAMRLPNNAIVSSITAADKAQNDELSQNGAIMQSHSGSFGASFKTISAFPTQYHQIATATLFPSKAFASDIREGASLTEYALRLLVFSLPADDNLAEYYLASVFARDPSSAPKAAKALLKARPSSLRLYNAYAIIESRAGRSASANKVFATAIAMSHHLPLNEQTDVVLLWRTWAWEALRSNDIALTMRRVLSIGEEKPNPQAESQSERTSTAVLKARNWLTAGHDHALSASDWHSLTLYVDCLALQEYLRPASTNHTPSATTPPVITADLPSALAVYASKIHALSHPPNQAPALALELLHQARASLLVHHALHHPSLSPSLLRAPIAESLSLFPSNTNFLILHAANQSRFRLDDRIRLATSTATAAGREREKTVVELAFDVFVETQRYKELGVEMGGTVHAVRAAFERAVSSLAGMHAVRLWEAYVRFEIEHALSMQPAPSFQSRHRASGGRKLPELRLEKAKAVYLRGLRALPWSKAFLMLGFEVLRDEEGKEGGLRWEEMRGVWDGLGERELRVHTDIEGSVEEVARRRRREG